MVTWMFRRLTALVAILFIAQVLSAEAVTDPPPVLEKVGETESLSLFFNFEQPGIAVQDRRNGYIWKSFVSPDEFGLEGVNKKWRNVMKSLFTFNYYAAFVPVQFELRVDRSKPHEYYRKMYLPQLTDVRSFVSAEGQKHELDIKRIENGVSVTYQFGSLGIHITVDIYVEENELRVEFPVSGIEESKTFAVADIQVLPFFGAAGADEDGYIFYPDGSGALTYLRKEKPPVVERYVWPVFGSAEVDPSAISA